jgi:hypothetical protein
MTSENLITRLNCLFALWGGGVMDEKEQDDILIKHSPFSIQHKLSCNCCKYYKNKKKSEWDWVVGV